MDMDGLRVVAPVANTSRRRRESRESKEFRESRGGKVGFVHEYYNPEHVAPMYDRTTEFKLHSTMTRRQKIQVLQVLSVICSAQYVAMASFGVGPKFLAPLKVIPVGVMLLMVVTLGDQRSYGMYIALGLFFCALGDASLELEGVPSFTDAPLFLIGLASGLIGHCAYARAFFSQAKVTLATAAPPIGAAAVVLNVLRPKVPAAELVPVSIYVVTVATMMVLALSRHPDGFAAQWSWWCGTTGAIIFALSDSILAYARFAGVDVDARFPVKLATATSYFLAQFLIAMSARGSQPRPLSKALGSVENFSTAQHFRTS